MSKPLHAIDASAFTWPCLTFHSQCIHPCPSWYHNVCIIKCADMASGSTHEAASSPSSILFQTNTSDSNNNGSPAFVLFDIPRSLEEAQVPRGHRPPARIVSGPPPLNPFLTPEPRNGASAGHPPSAGAHIAELMAAAAAQSALDELHSQYSGPFCLPRVCGSKDEMVSADGHVDAGSTDTAGAETSEASRIRIPEGAEYLHGSIHELRQKFIDAAPQFNLIVLDPPWPNRSARRKKTGSYSTASSLAEIQQLLLNIPVPLHLTPDGLVAVWITNKSSVYDLVTSPRGLFASWGLELVTQWTWLKITSSGEPIFDMESAWRKPWETLLVARRIGAKAPVPLRPRVIVAVPDVHSRKPNLRRLFEDVLGRDYAALEVFARNLTSGWWSWGDQVLQFQAAEHWVRS
ncbi:MT-A70 domain-containing protein [Trichoderma chlorosporum]